MPENLPFWKRKSLNEMSGAEWESLCDGCGRCCLHKLREEETGALSFTNVACRLLDTTSCRCTDYAHRRRRVHDCVRLTPESLAEIDWLPPSCAYRRLAEGRDLPHWHPLLTGDPASVHRAGASVSRRVVSETRAGPLEHHIVAWPGMMPRRQKGEGTDDDDAGCALRRRQRRDPDADEDGPLARS
ncbi:MAG TPA: YcgN family cysteine cluster protein [Acetobacteraceae bacterium]|nr:YcgN family cysteine cluster protein [Acetobacteraceae bacterium]